MAEVKNVHGKPVLKLIQLIVRVRQRVVVFTKLAASRIITSRTRGVLDVQAVRVAMEEILDALCVNILYSIRLFVCLFVCLFFLLHDLILLNGWTKIFVKLIQSFCEFTRINSSLISFLLPPGTWINFHNHMIYKLSTYFR